MPVVEELIGLIGYKVTGTPELQQADKALRNLKKTTSDVGTALNKSLGGAGGSGSSALGRFSTMLRGGVSQLAIFARSVAAVVGVMVGITAAAAAAAYAVLKLGTAMVRSAGEAARLRREMQLTAKGMGTKQTNVEKLGLGFKAIGLKPEDSTGFVEGISEKANDAILSKDYSAFKKAGVSILTPDGTQRDTAGVATDVLLQYMSRYAKGADLKARMEAATGSERKKLNTQRNKAEIEARQFAKDWGISKSMLGALQSVPPEEFIRRMTDFNNKNPTATADQEARTQRIAEGWARLENTMDGLDKAFEGVGNVVADKLLPGLNTLADGFNSLFKWLRLIPETADEKRTREQIDATRAAIGQPTRDEAKAQAAVEAGRRDVGWMEWLFGSGDPVARARRAAEVASDELDDKRGRAALAVGTPGAAAAIDAAMQAAADLAEKMKYLQSITGKAGAGSVPLPQPRPNITGDVGSDKRVINVTNNNTVNVAAPPLAPGAVGDAATQGTLGAISTKGANTSTDAITAP